MSDAATADLLPTGPLHEAYFADPFVLKHEGRYYAYGTGGMVDGRAFAVLTSADLREWQACGGALEPISDEPRDYWAPEVAYAGGHFYMYYSVGIGDQGHHLRVAVADGPAGPFRDLGLNLTPDEPFAIDPHPFRASSGEWFLYFARDDLGGERPGTVLCVAPLHGMTRLGEVRTVLRASGDWQRYQSGRAMYGGVHDWHTLEGAFVLERGGQFHLLYSGGAWTGEGYGVGHAVADHPLGPFHEPQQAATVLRSDAGLTGPGHASVTQRGDEDILVFHAWNPEHTKRQLHAAPLDWSGGVPRVRRS